MNFINCTDKIIIISDDDNNVVLTLNPSDTPAKTINVPPVNQGIIKYFDGIRIASINYDVINIPPVVEDTIYIVHPKLMMLYNHSRPDFCSSQSIGMAHSIVRISALLCYNAWTDGVLTKVLED